jgi:hypothetical protein
VGDTVHLSIGQDDAGGWWWTNSEVSGRMAVSADANGPSHGPFESREAAEKDAEATLLGADCKGDKRRPIEHHAAIAFRQASFDLI